MSTPLPRTIAAGVALELDIKKSRFLTRLEPCAEPDAAADLIAAVRKEHWQATHNCTALIIGVHGETQRSSDDGEPAGTAGVPMLEVLRAQRLTDVVAIVTRYFGGVKLGAGGLVRAYSQSVADAVAAAPLLERVPATVVTVALPLVDAGRGEHALRTWAAQASASIAAVEYSPAPLIELVVPVADLDDALAQIAALGAGRWPAAVAGHRVVEVPAARLAP